MITDDDLEQLFYDPDSITEDLRNPFTTMEDAPDDNVGRKKCWWCHRPTVMKPLFQFGYEFCEHCKK